MPPLQALGQARVRPLPNEVVQHNGSRGVVTTVVKWRDDIGGGAVARTSTRPLPITGAPAPAPAATARVVVALALTVVAVVATAAAGSGPPSAPPLLLLCFHPAPVIRRQGLLFLLEGFVPLLVHRPLVGV